MWSFPKILSHLDGSRYPSWHSHRNHSCSRGMYSWSWQKPRNILYRNGTIRATEASIDFTSHVDGEWQTGKHNSTKKIRIGYVLKSADVGTLFSSWYSENSSHAHTRRHPHTFTNTCAHPPTLCTPAHTHAHPCIPAHTHSSSRTHSSSSRWVWTDQSYVIRPNTKKADRKIER